MTSPYSTVYRCYGTEGHLLYVGVTGDIAHRVYTHRRQSDFFDRVALVVHGDHVPTPEALVTELAVIATERPPINQHGNPRYGHLTPTRRREAIRAEIDALPVSPRPAVVVHELSDEEQERRYLAFVPGPDFLRRPERHLTQQPLTQVVPQRRRRTA